MRSRCYAVGMLKLMIVVLAALFAASCVPPAATPDGLDTATDGTAAAEAGSEGGDALPPHVDGGGMDSAID